MRAHYQAPIQSAAGALQTGATVSVFQNGTTSDGTQPGTLITGTVYGDAFSATPTTNPFISTSGDIDFYLEFPLRVDLGVQVPGQAQVFFTDVDVLRTGIVATVVTANYSLALTDQLILVNASLGNIALQLPAATAGLEYLFKRTDATPASAVAILPAAGLIDNASSLALNALGGAVTNARLWSDGTQWWSV
jgi:hypothetical protein